MNNDNGFTFIEIVSVLVLLGVVAAIAVTGFTSGDQMEAGTVADRLKVHLRYAQSRAMNSDVAWGIQFDGGTYTLIRDISGTPVPKDLPGESGQSVTFPGAVTGSVAFDSWGRPSGLSSVSIGTRTVTITQDTGFVP